MADVVVIGAGMAGVTAARELARAGVSSRRAAESLIREGRVRVNGTVAGIGTVVDPARDVIMVGRQRVRQQAAMAWVALHKPLGLVVSRRDEEGRRTVFDLLPDIPGLTYVGRLDVMTSGLLLLTTDGEAIHRLTHPRYGVEKEYLAEVDGVPTQRHLARLRRGVRLEDGPARAADARTAGRSGGRGAVRVVMIEGRKREVRRMLEAIGLPVRRLVRTRVGPIRLEHLRAGESRDLRPEEVRSLYRVAGL